MALCPKCGVEVQDGVQFCPACGANMSVQASGADPAYNSYDVAGSQSADPLSTPPVNAAPQQSYTPAGQSVETKKFPTGVIFIIAGIAVFAIAWIIQAMGGSSMFSMDYYPTDNDTLNFLIENTFYPGWVGSVALVGFGILKLLGRR